ncbi:MAG TPA: RMD1 family protein, partial [Polyangiaceae bacterium]|nr:RMD1 family protein [Polyangiaceae bacterium]
RSVTLAESEASVASVFDTIEPLAHALQRGAARSRQANELLRHIGGTLIIQHKMVGRVRVEESPELLWEFPHLERLYRRLFEEYELRERHSALERKLALISRTAETLLGLLHHRSSMRVEWYIVILIVAEILIMVGEILFLK